jgi:hypothetical protein
MSFSSSIIWLTEARSNTKPRANKITRKNINTSLCVFQTKQKTQT